MNWAGIGVAGNAWELCFRELEHLARRLPHISRLDPEQELLDVELPEVEQRAAVRREAARRTMVESI